MRGVRSTSKVWRDRQKTVKGLLAYPKGPCRRMTQCCVWRSD